MIVESPIISSLQYYDKISLHTGANYAVESEPIRERLWSKILFIYRSLQGRGFKAWWTMMVFSRYFSTVWISWFFCRISDTKANNQKLETYTENEVTFTYDWYKKRTKEARKNRYFSHEQGWIHRVPWGQNSISWRTSAHDSLTGSLVKTFDLSYSKNCPQLILYTYFVAWHMSHFLGIIST